MSAEAVTVEIPRHEHQRVTLRAAGPEDCERVWMYNFAPDVRAMSQRNEIVALVEHARWYAQRLATADAPMWIVEEWGTPVGVLRLDRLRTPFGSAARPGGAGACDPRCETTVISIALAASARGRGIGRNAIGAACLAWRRPIMAEIFADNYASRACFEACGFREIGENNSYVTYRWSQES